VPRTSADLPFLAITGRTQLWNTGAMSSRSKGLTAMWGDPIVKMLRADAERLGIGADDLVRVATERGAIEMRARLVDDLLPGQVFVPIHHGDQSVNRLIGMAARGIKVFAVSLTRLAGPAPKIERGQRSFNAMALPLLTR
jgi:anaerobic selenocysteine-containing dehydrogenase